MIVLVTLSSAATAAFHGLLARLGVVRSIGVIRCRLRRFTGADDDVVGSDDITTVLLLLLP